MQKVFSLPIQQDLSLPNSLLPSLSTYFDLVDMAVSHCPKSLPPHLGQKKHTNVYLGMYARQRFIGWFIYMHSIFPNYKLPPTPCCG